MRHYEVITYETGPRSCDRCGKLWQPWMLNQYPPVTNPPREVCDGCLGIDKAVGVYAKILREWDARGRVGKSAEEDST